jgi:hypothetical protein
MKILIVSSREYSISNRGIDIITTYLSNNNHTVDHLLFYTKKKKQTKIISPNLRQLYFYDRQKLYRDKYRYFLPGFLIKKYFSRLVKKQNKFDFGIYDIIILECGYPIFLSPIISSPIIYRQSDPIESGAFRTKRLFFKRLEDEIINKSFVTLSALEKTFFPQEFLTKYFFWHSGYIKPKTGLTKKKTKSFVYLGLASPDYKLIKLIAQEYPEYLFYLIGPYNNKVKAKNVVRMGYLGYEQYEDIISSASVFIMPLTAIKNLKKYSYTSKMFLAMHLGIPILVRCYGLVQNNDVEKKVYVYNTRKQALIRLAEIVSNIKSGRLDFKVSSATSVFLKDREYESNIKNLDLFFIDLFTKLNLNNK